MAGEVPFNRRSVAVTRWQLWFDSVPVTLNAMQQASRRHYLHIFFSLFCSHTAALLPIWGAYGSRLPCPNSVTITADPPASQGQTVHDGCMHHFLLQGARENNPDGVDVVQPVLPRRSMHDRAARTAALQPLSDARAEALGVHLEPEAADAGAVEEDGSSRLGRRSQGRALRSLKFQPDGARG